MERECQVSGLCLCYRYTSWPTWRQHPAVPSARAMVAKRYRDAEEAVDFLASPGGAVTSPAHFVRIVKHASLGDPDPLPQTDRALYYAVQYCIEMHIKPLIHPLVQRRSQYQTQRLVESDGPLERV